MESLGQDVLQKSPHEFSLVHCGGYYRGFGLGVRCTFGGSRNTLKSHFRQLEKNGVLSMHGADRRVRGVVSLGVARESLVSKSH